MEDWENAFAGVLHPQTQTESKDANKKLIIKQEKGFMVLFFCSVVTHLHELRLEATFLMLPVPNPWENRFTWIGLHRSYWKKYLFAKCSSFTLKYNLRSYTLQTIFNFVSFQKY